MIDIVVGALTGAASAALISGIFSLILYKVKRTDSKTDSEDVQIKALQYLLLSAIQQRGETYLTRGYITMEERRSLHKWHDLYHNDLHGNGDADLLMKEVDELHLRHD